jgi:hypothetical protein
MGKMAHTMGNCANPQLALLTSLANGERVEDRLRWRCMEVCWNLERVVKKEEV